MMMADGGLLKPREGRIRFCPEPGEDWVDIGRLSPEAIVPLGLS